MSERTRQHLDTFWELIDEILNALLFVLLGLEVLVLPFRREYVMAGVLAISGCSSPASSRPASLSGWSVGS